VNIRTGEKEFFGFVLLDQLNQVPEIFFAVKDFPFPVLNIFLKVISRGFGDAEILHGVGHLDAHFFANPEKMINGVAGCKNDRGIIKDVYPVFPEFLGWNTFDLDELPENNINIELFCQICIRRFF
jgi:hypothetical protein